MSPFDEAGPEKPDAAGRRKSLARRAAGRAVRLVPGSGLLMDALSAAKTAARPHIVRAEKRALTVIRLLVDLRLAQLEQEPADETPPEKKKFQTIEIE